jgi:hypothetical protein
VKAAPAAARSDESRASRVSSESSRSRSSRSRSSHHSRTSRSARAEARREHRHHAVRLAAAEPERHRRTVAKAEPEEEAAADESAPAQGSDSLEGLMAGAVTRGSARARGSRRGRHHAERAIDREVKELLEEAPVQDLPAVLKGVHRRSGACYQRFHQEGIVDVKIAIAPDGSAKALAFGDFAATPTGHCVEDVVRATRFPESPEGSRFDRRIFVH